MRAGGDVLVRNSLALPGGPAGLGREADEVVSIDERRLSWRWRWSRFLVMVRLAIALLAGD